MEFSGMADPQLLVSLLDTRQDRIVDLSLLGEDVATEEAARLKSGIESLRIIFIPVPELLAGYARACGVH